MHDRDKLRSELGLHITSDVLDGGGDRVVGCAGGAYDYAKVFHL